MADEPKKMGRPPKFSSPDEMYDLLDGYFSTTPPERWTWTGLCLATGTSKPTFNDYQDKEEYKDVVTRAKLMVENAYEISLRSRGNAGDIFGLKNFGWSDKTEQEITGSQGGPLVIRTNAIRDDDD
jgi:hypothetical protein